jgi:ATP-dependent helicase HrpB
MRAWRYADRANYALEACRRLGIHAQGARQVGPLFEQFLAIAREGGPGRKRAAAGSHVRGAEVRAGRIFRSTRASGSMAARCAANSCTSAAACSPGRAACKRRRCSSRRKSARSGPRRRGQRAAHAGDRGRGGVAARSSFPVTTGRCAAWFTTSRRGVVSRRERRFRDLVLEAKAGSDDAPECRGGVADARGARGPPQARGVG